jgi:hypothetical protein
MESKLENFTKCPIIVKIYHIRLHISPPTQSCWIPNSLRRGTCSTVYSSCKLKRPDFVLLCSYFWPDKIHSRWDSLPEARKTAWFFIETCITSVPVTLILWNLGGLYLTQRVCFRCHCKKFQMSFWIPNMVTKTKKITKYGTTPDAKTVCVPLRLYKMLVGDDPIR